MSSTKMSLLTRVCDMKKVGRVAGFGDIPPSFRNQPLAYNGRASSVVPSGTPIQRPYGVGADGLYPDRKSVV